MQSSQFVEDWLRSTTHFTSQLTLEEQRRLVDGLAGLSLEPSYEEPTQELVLESDSDYDFETGMLPSLPPRTSTAKSKKKYLGDSKVMNTETVRSDPTSNWNAKSGALSYAMMEDLTKLSLVEAVSKENGLVGGTLDVPIIALSLSDPLELEPSSRSSPSESDVSLELNLDPEYKNRAAASPQVPPTKCSDLLSTFSHPHFTSQPADTQRVTFYSSIDSIEDKSWLPRTFQHHRVTRAQFLHEDGPFRYLKNKKCPPSPLDYEENNQTEEIHYSEHRYVRTLQDNGRKMEVLCRFCRGKNWVLRRDFEAHMAFSHGILLEFSTLVPYPISMIKVLDDKGFTNIFVECGECHRWVELGHKLEGDKDNNYIRTQGLYYYYFSHFIKRHMDVHS